MADEAAPLAPSPEAGGSEPNEQNNENGEAKQPASKAPAVKPKAPAFHKFKDGDKEIALTKEEIERDYKKMRGADAKFREAAAAKQAVEDFQRRWEAGDESVLSDPRIPKALKQKLAMKWVAEQVEEELNPPDPRDLKLSETEKKLKAYEEKEAKEKQDSEERDYQEGLQKTKKKHYEILKKAGELTHLSADPESEGELLREMALHMRIAAERGEQITPEELVEKIHNKRFGQFYRLAQNLEGEELIEFFGEEVVSKMRKADLARLKAQREPQASHKNEQWTGGRDKGQETQRMSGWEAREHAAKILRGK